MEDIEMQSCLVKDGTSVQAVDYGNATIMGVRPYGRVIAFAMTLNCMVGTGCFGLPFAFASAGLGLTSSLLLLGTAASLVTMNYTLEAMARAEGLSSPSQSPTHQLTYRRHNFSCIGYLFAGQTGYNMVQIPLVLYSFGCLWSSASIFSSSSASMFYSYILGGSCDAYASDAASGCAGAYYVSMAAFSVGVIVLVLMEMGDQAGIQKVLTIYRIVALSLMTGTMAIKLYIDGWGAIEARLAARAATSPSFTFAHFSVAFGSTILALNCHHNMPDIMQPLSSKPHARQVAFAAMSVGCLFYLLLGILGSLAFDHVNPLASLMWSDFTGCGNGWHPCSSSSSIPGSPPTSTWVGSAVHVVVIMFPVMNILSTYPMCGITLASNLISALPKTITAPLGPSGATQVSRMLAILPTLVLAAIFKNLDEIFTVTGLFGFVIGLVVPCWFQVVGISACRRRFSSTDDRVVQTPYSVPYLSSVEAATGVLSLMLAATAVATVSILFQA